MNNPAKPFLALILFLAVTAHCAETKFAPLPLEGQTFIHDPSTIVKEGDRFYIFGTGPGIRTKSSPDLIHWTNGDSVFRAPPAWATKAVPGLRNSMWAPDVIRVDGKFYLYYSVSTFGKQTSDLIPFSARRPHERRKLSPVCEIPCGRRMSSGWTENFICITPSRLSANKPPPSASRQVPRSTRPRRIIFGRTVARSSNPTRTARSTRLIRA